MMKTAGGTGNGNYDQRLSQVQAVNHQLQQELLHGNSAGLGTGTLQHSLAEAPSSSSSATGGKRAALGDQRDQHPSTHQGAGWMQGVLNQANEGGAPGESFQANGGQSNSKRSIAPRSRMNFDPNQVNLRVLPPHQTDGGSSATKQAKSTATGVGGASGGSIVGQIGQRHSSAQPHHYQNASSSK